MRTGDVPGANVWNLFVLSAAVCVVLGTVLIRRVHPTMSVLPLTSWAMLLGATVQLGFSFALGESVGAATPPLAAGLALLYLAGFFILEEREIAAERPGFAAAERRGPIVRASRHR